MPITFKTKSYADITMLNDVGKKMLNMMNFGNAIPGAIAAEDIGTALSNLQVGIDKQNSEVDSHASEDENEPTIALRTRAVPLLELLQSANADGDSISWR